MGDINKGCTVTFSSHFPSICTGGVTLIVVVIMREYRAFVSFGGLFLLLPNRTIIVTTATLLVAEIGFVPVWGSLT